MIMFHEIVLAFQISAKQYNYGNFRTSFQVNHI